MNSKRLLVAGLLGMIVLAPGHSLAMKKKNKNSQSGVSAKPVARQIVNQDNDSDDYDDVGQNNSHEVKKEEGEESLESVADSLMNINFDDGRVDPQKKLREPYLQSLSGYVDYILKNYSEAFLGNKSVELPLINQPIISQNEVESIIKEYVVKAKQSISCAQKIFNYSFLAKDLDSKEVNASFVTQLMLNAQDKVCFIGDIHGSLHSLLRDLMRLSALGFIGDNFTFKDSHFHLVCLGDYIDRGRFGVEVLYILMRLKLANWDRVHLLRGNHETASMAKKYTFQKEIEVKYSAGNARSLFGQFVLLFNLFPVALYGVCGSDVFIASHGGIPSAEDSSYYGLEFPGLEKVEYKMVHFNTQERKIKHAIFDHVKSIYKQDDAWYNDTKFLFNNAQKIVTRDALTNKKITTINWNNELSFTSSMIAYLWGDILNGPALYNVNNSAAEPFAYYKVFNNRSWVAYSGDVEANVFKAIQYKVNATPTQKYMVRALFRGHQHAEYGLKMIEPLQPTSACEKFKASISQDHYHWRNVFFYSQKNQRPISDQTIMNNIKYHNYEYQGFLLSTKTPIFTHSTAAEGVALLYDCFTILSFTSVAAATSTNYDEWRLRVYEYPTVYSLLANDFSIKEPIIYAYSVINMDTSSKHYGAMSSSLYMQDPINVLFYIDRSEMARKHDPVNAKAKYKVYKASYYRSLPANKFIGDNTIANAQSLSATP